MIFTQTSPPPPPPNRKEKKKFKVTVNGSLRMFCARPKKPDSASILRFPHFWDISGSDDEKFTGVHIDTHFRKKQQTNESEASSRLCLFNNIDVRFVILQ